jgi:hypothetical protein
LRVFAVVERTFKIFAVNVKIFSKKVQNLFLGDKRQENNWKSFSLLVPFSDELKVIAEMN